MPERSANLAGIGLMLLAVLLFSVNDALAKWLVATYAVAQILLIRSISASLMLAPFVLKAGAGAFRDAPRPRLQVLRAVLATAETVGFYFAVRYIPLADAVTFYLAGPIYVTALSAILLREKVGAYRWSAVIVGFVGVLIALNPSAASLNVGSLIALCGSIAYAFLMIATRAVRSTPNVVLAGAQVAGAIVFGAVGAPFAWTAVAGTDFLLLLLLGVVAVGRDRARQPVAETRAGLSRRSLPVLADRLGDGLRVFRLRRRPEDAYARWRRDHRRFGPLHLPARAAPQCPRRGGAGAGGALAKAEEVGVLPGAVAVAPEMQANAAQATRKRAAT